MKELLKSIILKSSSVLVLTAIMNSPLSAQTSNADLCKDFDQFVNGKWKAENPIPSTESRWGSFNILQKSNDKKVEGLVEGLMKKNYPKNSYQQQIGDFYRSLLDTASRNKMGMEPLKKYFKSIDNAGSFNDLFVLNALIPGVTLPVDGSVEQDLMNSKVNTFYLSNSGLTLGDKEFYLSDDSSKVKIRENFRNYIAQIEGLLGNSPKKAKKISDKIYSIEEDIAHYHLAKEDMRNPVKIYNKFTYSDLKNAAPTMDWDGFFRALNIQPTEVIVVNPDIIKNYQKIVSKHSISDWKEYMKFHLVISMSAYLPENIEKASFNFFSTQLNGVKEQLPLNERSIRRLNQLFGEPMGRQFVSKYFSPESKANVEHMIENMRSAYSDRIQNLTWMSDETKKAALHKLSTFTYKIGYPDKWKDYSSIDIVSNKVFENVMNINKFELKENLDKYGKLADKDEWEMNAHQVNAYYNPLFNEVVFPAGILQPPFYDPNADAAYNYGAIGAVIGHEFSHGFDDQGSQFDADGNLKNWWTDEDRAKFEKLTDKLADQYSNFEILPGLHVNGKYTLGENIADQGGLILAYYAMIKENKNKPTPPLVDGLNYKQRFFYGWANVWKQNATDEATRQLISLDPHSPAKARINVTFSNLKEFYDAFGCNENSNVTGDKVVIW